MVKRLSLIALLAVAGCNTASVPLAPASADAEGKRFAPPPAGMGTIYVARTGDGGTLIGITANQRVLGHLGNFTWLRVDVTPGTVDLRCMGGENIRDLQVPVAAGETKFVKTRASIGWQTLRCSLYEVDASEGRQAVTEGNRALEAR